MAIADAPKILAADGTFLGVSDQSGDAPVDLLVGTPDYEEFWYDFIEGGAAGTPSITDDGTDVSVRPAGEGNLLIRTNGVGAFAALQAMGAYGSVAMNASGAGGVATVSCAGTATVQSSGGLASGLIHLDVPLGALQVSCGLAGFFGATPVVAQPIGAVAAATPIGAALVSLGLCTADEP